MRMERDESGGTLKLSGELAIGSANELQKTLRDCLAGAPDPRIDLSGVSHCDTAALQLLCSARRTAGSLEFAGASDGIREACVALGLSLIEPEEACGDVV
jgi:anti-anti-sigma factor